ncbi:type II toxin-antitoxin system RelE/ParE family toxin [candidate division TA06 bacterium]|nr:type II toxin-antitoxin system RelE/ParE family toxin [candidate division TA06 bacterium]
MYQLLIRPRAERDLNRLSETEGSRLIEVIQALKENPRPSLSKKLMEDIHRVRVGRFRIIYIIDDKNKTVDIGKIDRRKERTYKRLSNLFK